MSLDGLVIRLLGGEFSRLSHLYENSEFEKPSSQEQLQFYILTVAAPAARHRLKCVLERTLFPKSCIN